MSSREKILEEIAIEEEFERRQCEKSYYYFFQCAWDVLEPLTPLVDNWHIKFLCDLVQKEIERIARRDPKTKDIVVNICPRSLKSYIFSILLAPWAWTKYPELRFLNSSHTDSLSTDNCVKSRRLIDSDWYQGHWGHVFQMTSDQNVKSHFENNRGGYRIATSTGAAVAGKGADIVTGDDLLDPKHGYSEAKITAANKHWEEELGRRLNDHHVGLRINIQQRVSEEDVTGVILQKYKDDYTHICIPVELDENISPPELKEYYTDGLFFPTRWNHADIEKLKKEDRMFVGQYLQRPSPKVGNIVQLDWWKFYDELPSDLDDELQSWDATFKGEEEAKGKVDYVVGLVIARKGTNIYIVDMYRDKADIDKTKAAMIRFRRDYPLAHKVFIEDKANGPAIQTQLKKVMFGLEAVEPMGNKVERIMAVLHLISSGHVHLPNPKTVGWVQGFINRVAAFPSKTVPDDEVDALSQGLLKIELAWDIITKYETMTETTNGQKNI